MNTQFSTSQWMTATPGIDVLSLMELSLPGTHNAGSDWKASYPLFGAPRHWIACQHDSFYHQLHHGARALDIRFIYEPEAEGLGKFRVHHGGSRNSRTLGHLVTDVNDFLRKNPDEFIVLDFHSLDGTDFDFAYFNQMIIHFLGERIIPRQNRYMTLAQLKNISPKQRILVAAESRALDGNVFIDRVVHKWSGQTFIDTTELGQFIGEVMENPPSKWGLWSLSATSYTALIGPKDIHTELDKWFDPNTSDWAQRCNIINVDFIEESRIVDFCHTANLNKARQRSA
ncbi:1-phosphatidylinositol phosphodiesterase [Pseudomonas sp. EB276 TE3739]|uniref:phospholipase n=1 Tax=Pseudomonas TaxID=286 RepID=UPI0020A0448E|nr:phospholipase [Pseudomonas koreensis]MCP1476380.1 1-phosphatidylinositol phosphodiesterase [Pseudomonas koreensis]